MRIIVHKISKSNQFLVYYTMMYNVLERPRCMHVNKYMKDKTADKQM